MYEITLIISEAIRAGIKESTLNPEKSDPASQNTRAFTIKRNKPNVSTVRGRVSNAKMGLIVTLSTPRIAAARIAEPKLRTCIPGTKLATNNIDTVVIIHDMIMPLMADLPKSYC